MMVSCRRDAEVLRLVVDNDAGALGAAPPMGTGLTNLRQRLQRLYGERGNPRRRMCSAEKCGGAGLNSMFTA